MDEFITPEAPGLKGTNAILQIVASYSSALISSRPIHMLLSLLPRVDYGLFMACFTRSRGWLVANMLRGCLSKYPVSNFRRLERDLLGVREVRGVG
jgi:hypothetical protein